VVGELARLLQSHLQTAPFGPLREPMADEAKEPTEESKGGVPLERRNYIKVEGVITKKGSDIRVMQQQDVNKYTCLEAW
jgi:hypothetical protein